MKQNIVFSLFLVLSFNFLISFNLSAQYSYSLIGPDVEYYSTNLLSSVAAGKGNTGVASLGDVASIYLNPATLDVSKKYQLYAGYNLKSESEEFKQNIFSFSIAGGYRINKYLQTGLAYQNDYSYSIESTMHLFENDDDETTFETHSFRISVVFEYKWMRVGMNINLSNYYESTPEFTANLWKLNPEIGTIITPIKEFSIGVSFIPGFKSDLKLETNNNYYLNNNYYADFPDRYKIGTEIRTSDNKSKFSFDYHYTKISNSSYLRDFSDLHFGFERLINENWTFRCGFFTLQDGFEDHLYFLTLGTSFKFNNYSFNLAGLINMYGGTSDEYYVLNFGAGYEF